MPLVKGAIQMIETSILDRDTLRFEDRVERMTESTCQHCSLFVDDPAAIELEFPSVRILGSFYASVRGSAGICRERDRFMDPIPAADCPTFVPRGVANDGESPRG